MRVFRVSYVKCPTVRPRAISQALAIAATLLVRARIPSEAPCPYTPKDAREFLAPFRGLSRPSRAEPSRASRSLAGKFIRAHCAGVPLRGNTWTRSTISERLFASVLQRDRALAKEIQFSDSGAR